MFFCDRHCYCRNGEMFLPGTFSSCAGSNNASEPDQSWLFCVFDAIKPLLSRYKNSITVDTTMLSAEMKVCKKIAENEKCDNTHWKGEGCVAKFNEVSMLSSDSTCQQLLVKDHYLQWSTLKIITIQQWEIVCPLLVYFTATKSGANWILTKLLMLLPDTNIVAWRFIE